MDLKLDDSDVIFCKKLHCSIPRNTPTVLAIFNNDSFNADSYLELRYNPADYIAHLYYCGCGWSKVESDNFYSIKNSGHNNSTPLKGSQLLSTFDALPYLNSARISGKKLNYILHLLDCLQRLSCDNHPFTCRDGNTVYIKSFWKSGFTFTYWSSAPEEFYQLNELVWILADYLPRPARDSLQPSFLPPDTLHLLQTL